MGKYSRPVSWKGTPSLGKPKYSKPVSWKGTQGGNVGRYSRPVSWKGYPTLKAPKYSKPVSWKGYPTLKAPKYSQPVSWKGYPTLKAPKYSKPVSWRGYPTFRSPRYSKPVSWKGAPGGNVNRYSKPVSWKGAYFPGKPRYSSFKNRFVVSKKWKKMTNKYNPLLEDYRGFHKYKKPNYKNMHPSVNYMTAKNIPIKFVRKGLRKWNIFWVRLNDSKLQPKGVRKVAKKPKFDKKEKDIWNNGRDKKPTTRNDATSEAELPSEETTQEEGEGNQ